MSLLSRLIARQPQPQEQRLLTSSSFVPPAYDEGSFSADLVSSHRAMANTAVFACVRLLADTIASMPWYVYKRDKNNLPQRIFPTPKSIRKPCPDMDVWQWKWMVMATLLLRGNSFHLITGRDKADYPTSFMPLHPDMVHVERRVNVLEWYDPIYRVMGERVPSEDIVHIRRFTLPGEPLGLTPIQQAAASIGMGLAAENYGLRYFKDSANPSSILRTDQTLTDEEIERNQKQWISSHGGRGRYPAILSGGFEWKPISISPNESQFLETRGYQVTDIAMFYGVPPHLIGHTEKSTSWGTGIEQQNIGFNSYSVRGWTSCIESVFSNFLPAGQFVKFDPSALLQGDIKTRYDSYMSARNSGWMSVNEIRQREELPPIKDGDGYIQPMNYAPLGFDPAVVPMPKPVPEGTVDGGSAPGSAPEPSGTRPNEEGTK